MDMRSELEEIKDRLDSFYADHCDWQSHVQIELKQALQEAQHRLDRAIEHVEQDYVVSVDITATVRVRANNEDAATDIAVEKINNTMDIVGFDFDIDGGGAWAEPAID